MAASDSDPLLRQSNAPISQCASKKTKPTEGSKPTEGPKPTEATTKGTETPKTTEAKPTVSTLPPTLGPNHRSKVN